MIAEALNPPEPAPESVVVEPKAPAIEERPATETPIPPPSGDLAPASPRQEARQTRRRRRVERFEQVHELKRQGRSIRGIARELGLSRKAVRRYLRRASCPDWRPGRATRSGMDRYREEVDRRIAEGCTNAAELHRDLAARGCRLSYGSVRRYVTKRLAAAGKSRSRQCCQGPGSGDAVGEAVIVRLGVSA
jgi:predicted transcriptional regulator